MSRPLALLLVLAASACALATFAAVAAAWTPLGRAARRWAFAYLAAVDGQLRALFSPLRARTFALYHGVLVAAGLLLGLLRSWACALVLAPLCACLPMLWLARRRWRRRRMLEGQLDAALQSLAHTLLVLQNLEAAFVVVAEHFPPPISQEADLLVKQVRLGTPMDQALEDLACRCRSRNVDALVTALTLARRTGGDLPAVLERTAQVLREGARVEGVMDSKTAEGKAQVALMSSLPLVFAGALELIDPGWLSPLLRDPIGWVLLTVAGALELAGILLVRRLSRIDA